MEKDVLERADDRSARILVEVEVASLGLRYLELSQYHGM